jgi:HlyD family secretion protein
MSARITTMMRRVGIVLLSVFLAGAVLLWSGLLPSEHVPERLRAVQAMLRGTEAQDTQRTPKDADRSARAPAAQDPPAEPRAPAVSVTRAKIAELIDRLPVTGSLVAREEITVAPEIEGYKVLTLEVEEGETVTAGRVLARLVAETIDTQLAQNDAGLARADAAIAQAASTLIQAEARLVEAKNAMDRARPLRQGGHLSESTFDQREMAARTAEAQVAVAREGQRLAAAERAQVEAQRKELLWRRNKTEVRAPAAGLVTRRNARVGAVASAAGEPMFRIAAGGEIELAAEIAETRLGKVRAGQAARIQVPGHGFFDGRVRMVAPEVERSSRTARVRIALGVRPELKLGAFARGTIEIGRETAVTVPASAVLFTGEGASVQVVVNDHVATRTVEVGLAADGLLQLRRGVGPSELVVAKAGTFLREGDLVRPMPLSDDRPNFDATTHTTGALR